MRVQVQQARQASLCGEVQRPGPSGHSDRGADRNNLTAVDEHGLVQQRIGRQAIDKPTTTYDQGARGGTDDRRGHNDSFAHCARHTPWRQYSGQYNHQCNHQSNR